jgi:hypothetical protein
MAGVALEVSAVGAYAGLVHREAEVRDANPGHPGFLTAADRYLALKNAVAPLAIVGGSLMAESIPVGPRSARWGSRGWAIASLGVAAALLGTGLVLLVREPDEIGRTRLGQPDRQAGALLIGVGLPLASYGITFYGFRARTRSSERGSQ